MNDSLKFLNKPQSSKKQLATQNLHIEISYTHREKDKKQFLSK